MADWREMAAAALASPSAPLDDRPRRRPDLPEELAMGLVRLADRRPPRIEKPSAWGVVIGDADYLAQSGWAAKALALGWSPHDLFGVGPESSDQFESLAVWLDGRKVAAMGEWKARTTCGAMFYRDEYGRPKTPRHAPVFLWDWGRGQGGR